MYVTYVLTFLSGIPKEIQQEYGGNGHLCFHDLLELVTSEEHNEYRAE